MSDIKWTNDKVKLGDLQPWEYNPRHSTEKQAERITESERLFGQVETLAIGPDNECYNGHQRLGAWLAEYGPDFEIEVRRSSRKLDDQERQALTVVLHAGAVGSWDWDTLASWDTDILQGFGFDEDLLKGWQQDTFALGDLLASENGQEAGKDTEPQIDKAEKLREKWQVEVGQMWQLGEHRLICGDCTDKAVVDRVMGGERASFTAIDPPYIGREDLFETDGLLDFLNSIDLSVSFVFWPANFEYPLSYDSIHIWHKSVPIHPDSKIGNVAGHQFERIYTKGIGKKCTVIREAAIMPNFAAVSGEFEEHPTQKPLKIYIDLLSKVDKKEIIIDYYCGSGTTIIACENLSRRCRAVEISPAYVGVSLQRYLDHTGKQPQLLNTS